MKMMLVHSGIMLLFYELHAVQVGSTELRVLLDDWMEFAAVPLLLSLLADVTVRKSGCQVLRQMLVCCS